MRKDEVRHHGYGTVVGRRVASRKETADMYATNNSPYPGRVEKF